MEISNCCMDAQLLKCQSLHIIKILVDNIGNLKDISYIILNLALGVGAFKGLGYLKTYREKRNAATFTFWVQLRVRMMEIKSWLATDYSLIDYLYDEKIRGTWESESTADIQRIICFKKIVEESIQFIKTSSDQIPAYVGWTDDYNKFIAFLNDLIQFDISDGDNYFKYEEESNISDRNQYVIDICEIIDRMCQEIVIKQKSIENEL